jgi:predicted DNA-binding transcriptional regulator YafY
LQAKTMLSEEEAEFINSSMRSLIELSKAYLEESVRVIKNKVASIDPRC